MVEDIIKKNKQKRNNYVTRKPRNNSSKIKYFRNLITRSLLTIILVLGSIIYTNLSAKNKELYQKYVLENSLSFNKINNIYQDLFGKVDILSKKESTPVFKDELNVTRVEAYQNSYKLMVSKGSSVSALASGIVVFMGEKDDLGYTIIVQGNDGVDIWYSGVTSSELKVYDYIESTTIIGITSEDYLYITLNKDGEYLNYEEYISQI